MAPPVLIEFPIEIMILVLSPYFTAVILTIIYVHKKYKFTKIEPSNDYDDSGSNNNENSIANPT